MFPICVRTDTIISPGPDEGESGVLTKRLPRTISLVSRQPRACAPNSGVHNIDFLKITSSLRAGERTLHTLFRCIHPSTMHYFRKKTSSPSTPTHSRPPTPTTPPVELARRELTTFNRTKGQRALAALPVAVALSCIPPSSDFKGTTPDEPGPSKVSKWKNWTRVYGAARMVVEAANESSDMCLPLKAVVGALSVLIKNCDVCHT